MRIMAPLRKTQAVRPQTSASGRNLSSLKGALAKAGFEGLDSKLHRNIRRGQKEFSLPLSYYASENRNVDFKLSFARDANGNYRLENYQAALIDTNSPEASKNRFSLAGWDRCQAVHLLAGRAIEIGSFDVSAGSKSKWIQQVCTDMKQETVLKTFFSAIETDRRLGISHIGLYVTLICLWEKQGSKGPVVAFGKEVMALARIESTATYQRLIRQLVQYGYICYEPSYYKGKASRIFLHLKPQTAAGIDKV